MPIVPLPPTDIAALEGRWREHRRLRRRRDLVWLALFLLAFAAALQVGQVRLSTLIAGLPSFTDYFVQATPELHVKTLGPDLAAWYWDAGHWALSLLDTVMMAIVATALGVAGGVTISIFAARNLAPSRGAYIVARRLSDLLRAIPELVSATVLVFAFGIGPFAGVMALALHSVGALAKLFAEVAENSAAGPMEGVRASGGSWLQVIRYGLLPQVLPNWTSYALLRFEINVRSATILGFVGAGGIGQDLMFATREFLYTDVSAIVLMIIATVMLLDLGSERLRHGLMSGNGLGGLRLGRAAPFLWGGGFCILLALFWHFGFFNPAMLGRGLARFGGILGFMLPPRGFDEMGQLLGAVGQTLGMALAGSVLANIFALPLGVLAARNVVGLPAVHFLVHRFLDVLRGVDVLIWALIFISVVGLGPFAGILAIMVNDTGALAKLYGEAIEAVDFAPAETVFSAGGGKLLALRYGVMPQVLPVILSNAIYFFESNTRSATVLGVVGAGGIGLALFDRIRVDDWHSASLVVLLIVLTVMLIDALTGAARRRLM
ncbi:phosphonate ABC transporter, permease protein PhnE [Acidocella sp.]|jgi:phosphonate transport system permease protein|uniref:phosphonate ABC transporter, permease protein PhnE n=1 Tax=Acidocella sp. TaxID=50710 RepID=UPI002F428F5F